MRFIARAATLLMAATVLVNCGSHAALTPNNSFGGPAPAISKQGSDQVVEQFADGIPDVFAAAKDKTVTDADLDSYIDASVTGADRAVARKFMKMMPKRMRGDFVYLGPHDRLISNNPRLLSYIRVTHSSQGATFASARSTVSEGRRAMDYGWQSSCAPPGKARGTSAKGRRSLDIEA